MPRLSHNVLLRAYKISNLLPLILRQTRTIPSAVTELRWLKKHVEKTAPKEECETRRRNRLLSMVKRRARSEPLQYILGSQPFGEFDIKCAPGVLIPRSETEAYTMHLAELLEQGKLHPRLVPRNLAKSKKTRVKKDRGGIPQPERGINILDACSGSGCISLVLHKAVKQKYPSSEVIGVDISKKAVQLARVNVLRNRKILKWDKKKSGSASKGTKHILRFSQRDIFGADQLNHIHDMIVANPPYISHEKFSTEVERSVRNWEPRLALVPHVPKDKIPGYPNPEDIFYHRLIFLHHVSFSKILLVEVGDAAQAIRVIKHALSDKDVARCNEIKIWRDFPSQDPEKDKSTEVFVDGISIPIIGAGKVRCVLLHRTAEFVLDPEKHLTMKHPKLDCLTPTLRPGPVETRKLNGRVHAIKKLVWGVGPVPVDSEYQGLTRSHPKALAYLAKNTKEPGWPEEPELQKKRQEVQQRRNRKARRGSRMDEMMVGEQRRSPMGQGFTLTKYAPIQDEKRERARRHSAPKAAASIVDKSTITVTWKSER